MLALNFIAPDQSRQKQQSAKCHFAYSLRWQTGSETHQFPFMQRATQTCRCAQMMGFLKVHGGEVCKHLMPRDPHVILKLLNKRKGHHFLNIQLGCHYHQNVFVTIAKHLGSMTHSFSGSPAEPPMLDWFPQLGTYPQTCLCARVTPMPSVDIFLISYHKFAKYASI